MGDPRPVVLGPQTGVQPRSRPWLVPLRLVLSMGLVLLTFNPTGTSYFHAARAILPAVNGLFALEPVLLLTAWVVMLRATFRSLGFIGVMLVGALLGALIWVGADLKLFDLHDSTLRVWLSLLSVGVVLTVGLSWGDLRRSVRP